MNIIQEELQIQRNRLLTACEKKVKAMEILEAVEDDIREARMGVATLEFALKAVHQEKMPHPEPTASSGDTSPLSEVEPPSSPSEPTT